MGFGQLETCTKVSEAQLNIHLPPCIIPVAWHKTISFLQMLNEVIRNYGTRFSGKPSRFPTKAVHLQQFGDRGGGKSSA